MNRTRLFIYYGILFLMALLLGCNDSSKTKSSVEGDTSNSIEERSTGVHTSAQVDAFIEGLVERADLIVSGEVESIDYKDSVEGIAHTFVTFKINEIIDGTYLDGDRITLKLVGGYFGANMDYHLSVSNSPEFELGEKSVLMIQKSEDSGCDLVGCELGRFVIDNGNIVSANESAVLVGDKGDVKYIPKSERNNGEYKTRLDRMSLAKFVSYVREVAVQSSNRRKARARVVVKNIDMNLPFNAPESLTRAGQAPSRSSKVFAKMTPPDPGSDFDRWEENQLLERGGNPVFGPVYYPGN